MTDAPHRRLFLQSLGALPVAAASALLPTSQTKAMVPAESAGLPAVTEQRMELLDRYIAFLAHEHRAALNERYPGYKDFLGQWHDPNPPMFWLPCAPDIAAMVQSEAPSKRRALLAMVAVDPDRGLVGRILAERERTASTR